MAIPLTITIHEAQGFLTLSKVLTLGSTYEVTVAGVEYEGVEFTLTNHDGDTVAASADGVLALNTQDLKNQWPTNERCPAALALQVYAVSDDAVIGTGMAIVKWSPYIFDEAGLPISLTGATGADGKSAYQSWLDAGNLGSEEDFAAWLKGEKGDTGEAGQNGVYIPMGGMYAFSVDESGHLIIHAQDGDKLHAVDSAGNPDYTTPLFSITEAGHIAYTFYDNGEPIQVIDLGSVVGPKGDAFEYTDFTPEQLALLKGEDGADGADGLTEGEVQAVVEAYEYATEEAVALKADKTEIADMATNTAMTAALALKQNLLVWDSEPTAGSANAVSSGVLKTMFDTISASIASAVGLNVDEVKAIVHQMFIDLPTTKPTTLFETELRVQQICQILHGV